MRLLLVGAGKMGSALLRRWQEQSIADEILVIDTARNLKSPKDLPAGFAPDVVLLAVKPQTLPDILADYRHYADDGALFVSVAAGRTTAFFEQHLGNTAKVVRAMPNTPAAIGEGITGAFANKNVSIEQRAIANQLLSPVGEVMWFEDENQMDAVTALSGSGPAYVFLLIEAMTAAGVDLGLDAAVSAKLARQTVIGSAALAKADAHVPTAVLRESVTSPGGTTAAALDVLMQDNNGLKALMQKALRAATDRAKELNS